MLTYCLKCKVNIKNIDSEIAKIRNNRLMLPSKCAICGSKKTRFMKGKEAKGLLSNLGIKSRLSKIPVLGNILV